MLQCTIANKTIPFFYQSGINLRVNEVGIEVVFEKKEQKQADLSWQTLSKPAEKSIICKYKMEMKSFIAPDFMSKTSSKFFR